MCMREAIQIIFVLMTSSFATIIWCFCKLWVCFFKFSPCRLSINILCLKVSYFILVILYLFCLLLLSFLCGYVMGAIISFIYDCCWRYLYQTEFWFIYCGMSALFPVVCVICRIDIMSSIFYLA